MKYDLTEVRYKGSREDIIKAIVSINKTQLKKTYTKESIVNFADWIRNNPYVWQRLSKLNDQRTTEELFEIWEKDNIK
jgi:hypothetical protein